RASIELSVVAIFSSVAADMRAPLGTGARSSFRRTSATTSLERCDSTPPKPHPSRKIQPAKRLLNTKFIVCLLWLRAVLGKGGQVEHRHHDRQNDDGHHRPHSHRDQGFQDGDRLTQPGFAFFLEMLSHHACDLANVSGS